MFSFFKNESALIETLYNKHRQEIYAVCFSYCRNKADAEDCLQNVFCRAVAKISELKKHPAPEKWLFVTARLVSLEKIRSTGTKNRRELDISDFEAALQAKDFEDELLERQYSETDILLLRNEILNTLNKKDSELYTLRYVDCLDIEAISQRLNISYSNATTRLSRLKSKIIKYVQKLFCD